MSTLQQLAEAILQVDNPGGNWLRDHIDHIKQSGENQYGGPNRFGPVTGSFTAHVLVPVKELVYVPGIMGEQNRTREDSMAYLVAQMEKTGKLPIENGKQYVPFIMVDYAGQPWINEGNHRIKAARYLKWKYLPIELRYFSGGEDMEGPLTPDIALGYDAMATSEGYLHGNDFCGIPEPNAV
jgi:hypothetical protein